MRWSVLACLTRAGNALWRLSQRTARRGRAPSDRPTGSSGRLASPRAPRDAYLGRTPHALRGKLQVIERGADLVLAAHFTPVGAGPDGHDDRDRALRAAPAHHLPPPTAAGRLPRRRLVLRVRVEIRQPRRRPRDGRAGGGGGEISPLGGATASGASWALSDAEDGSPWSNRRRPELCWRADRDISRSHLGSERETRLGGRDGDRIMGLPK
jgi:hypothetical protein